MKLNREETIAISGDDIQRKFLSLIEWAKGGSLYLVTPFINEIELRSGYLSTSLMQLARRTMDISLMVAPPNPPHKKNYHMNDDDALFTCKRCVGAATKISLLNIYFRFVEDLLIKDTLHGKVFLARNLKGKLKCLTGSVNLTHQAFEQWCEIGIYTDEQRLIKTIEEIISSWQGPARGGRAKPYQHWMRDYYRNYPHILYLLTRRNPR